MPETSKNRWEAWGEIGKILANSGVKRGKVV
jgi:hypothetical protein